jgi:hypothetical protein
VQSNFVVPIMLGQNSSRLVGMMAGHFQWGKFMSGLILEHVSGKYPPPSPITVIITIYPLSFYAKVYQLSFHTTDVYVNPPNTP